MNFLQPGGSSVPHPHLQLQIRGVPFSAPGRVLARGAEYRAREGRSYWRDLSERERSEKVRWLGRAGPVEWLVAWAPCLQREVWGLLPGVGSLLELDEAAAGGFAEGIAKVVSYYESIGSHPFTLAFFSSPQPGQGGAHELQVRICARPGLRATYANYDTWFAPLYGGDGAHVAIPERYAAELQARW
jgi:galactose-1-phosphate uridylyltransferase